MPIYKVSYVVPQRPHEGTILMQDTPPRVGDVITLRETRYRVREVIDLLPSRGVVRFLHATVEPITDAQA